LSVFDRRPEAAPRVGFRTGEEKDKGVIAKATREAGWVAIALLLVLVALLAAGCGGDGGNGNADQPANDPELVDQATQKIDRAAAASANPVKDRYIPGRKRFKVVCLSPEEARAKNVGNDFIQCHVEAFSTPTKKRPESVYVESEDWRVPVDPDGNVGDPVIVDGYRIADFLRKDNRLGCSVGRTPTDRCKNPFGLGP
jgi:hypothetical protein